MKKQLALCLAFIVMLTSSCQKDPNTGQVGQDGMVDFSITTTLPQGPDAYTRTGTAPKNSALGGLANVDQTKYDLRYIMEVWTIGTDSKKVYREVKIAGEDWGTAVTFDARLIAQKYNFVFWADFVTKQKIEITEKGLVDLHYTTTTLDNIVFKGDYKVSDDTRDAYFHKEVIDLSVSTNKISVSLKRPFAKVRFIATDRPLNDVNNSNLVPASSTIEYPDAKFYTEFNAITGLAMGTPSVRDNATLLTAKPTPESATDTQKDYLLVFDYILPGASVASIGESNISTVIDGITASRPNLPSIPIVANTLVTLKGNLYSNRGVVTVDVTDAFASDTDVPVADIVIETVTNASDIETTIDAIIAANSNKVVSVGVKVETAVPATTTITIPSSILAEKTPAITYDLSAGITSGATLTIGDASVNTGTTYAGTINVIVPETNAGSVIINAPNAHVTINGKYATLTAATSATTLVIEAGATIETLTVTAGNVEIHGDVTTLVNNGSGKVIEHVATSVGLTKALNRNIAIEIQLANGTYYATSDKKKTFKRLHDLKIIGATKGGVTINNVCLYFNNTDESGNDVNVDLEVQNIIFNDSKPSSYSSIIRQFSYSSQLIVKDCEFNVSGGTGSNNSTSVSIYTKSGKFDIDNCKFTNNETVKQPYAIHCLVNGDSGQEATPIQSRITNTTFETNATFATDDNGITKDNSTAIYIQCNTTGQVIDYLIENCTINNYYYAISSVESNYDFGVGSKIAISNVTMNNWYNIWTYSPNVTWNISNSTLNAVNPHDGASSDNGNIHIENAKIEMNFTNVKMSTKSTGNSTEPSRIYPFRIRMDKIQPDGNIVTLNFIEGNTITEYGNITSGADTWRPKYMIHEAGYRRMTNTADFTTLYPNVSNRITVTGTPTITGVAGATLRNEDIFGDEFILFNNDAYKTYLLGLAGLDTNNDKKISVVEAANFKGAITRPAGAVELNAKRVENFFSNVTK